LLGFQAAFDLYDNASQEFLQKLTNTLPKGAAPVADAKKPGDGESEAMETDELLASTATADPLQERFFKIQSILSGEYTVKLQLEFLYRNNHYDGFILDTTKAVLDARSSVFHQGVVFSNAFMNAGTTNDEFLRKNMDWLGKASNWAKFSATATLGVIHKGQIHQGKELLKQYLPQDGVTGSPYSEGGALYALGFIHANHEKGVVQYLTKILKSTQSEVVQHGACLGIGVSSISSDNPRKLNPTFVIRSLIISTIQRFTRI
jgi:26S proteasome regulatory subunit N2